MLLLTKRFFITVAVVAVIISLLFFGRNFLLRPSMVVEQESVSQEAVAEGTLLRSGSFVEIDAIHKGSGQALILETPEGPVLKFENFRVSNGPDLFVYLSKSPDVEATKLPGEFISLGRLKAYEGEQSYNLPDNLDEYRSVVIWCRAFGVLFSVAKLE